MELSPRSDVFHSASHLAIDGGQILPISPNALGFNYSNSLPKLLHSFSLYADL